MEGRDKSMKALSCELLLAELRRDWSQTSLKVSRHFSNTEVFCRKEVKIYNKSNGS